MHTEGPFPSSSASIFSDICTWVWARSVAVDEWRAVTSKALCACMLWSLRSWWTQRFFLFWCSDVVSILRFYTSVYTFECLLCRSLILSLGLHIFFYCKCRTKITHTFLFQAKIMDNLRLLGTICWQVMRLVVSILLQFPVVCMEYATRFHSQSATFCARWQHVPMLRDRKN